MPQPNFEISLDLTWSANCFICKADRVPAVAINATKLYIPIVTSSTQDNAKLLHKLKSGFKRMINWNNINHG